MEKETARREQERRRKLEELRRREAERKAADRQKTFVTSRAIKYGRPSPGRRGGGQDGFCGLCFGSLAAPSLCKVHEMISASTSAGVTCPGQHSLSRFVTPRPSFICDGCRETQSAGACMRSCRKCNFDLCETCYANRRRPPKNGCPGKHQLASFYTPNASFRCDGCKKGGFKTHTLMFGCRTCNWDMCVQCWNSAARAPVEPVAASKKVDPTYSPRSREEFLKFDASKLSDLLSTQRRSSDCCKTVDDLRRRAGLHIAIGHCGHAFHRDCILDGWKRGDCPACESDDEWSTKTVQDIFEYGKSRGLLVPEKTTFDGVWSKGSIDGSALTMSEDYSLGDGLPSCLPLSFPTAHTVELTYGDQHCVGVLAPDGSRIEWSDSDVWTRQHDLVPKGLPPPPTIKKLRSYEPGQKAEMFELGKELSRMFSSDDVGPSHWTKLRDGANDALVRISPSTPEYKEALRMFKKTSSKTVVRIERIQNAFLWRRYLMRKMTMISKNANVKDGITNARLLFHGTRRTDPSLIWDGLNASGFDPRLGQGYYGVGGYFAQNARYSESYEFKVPGTTLRQMFLATVLTGVFKDYGVKTEKNLKRAPELPRSHPNHPGLYDSVKGGPHSGSFMYIVYSSDQAYPLYLYTYK